MATPKSQRIGIWIIAIVLMLGTFGSFLVMALSVQNKAIDTANQKQEYDKYVEQQKVVAKLNADNSDALTGYTARTFDATSVAKLSVEVLVAGTGATLKSSDTVKCSYFGWTSDGKIFDSSKKKSSEDSPAEFPLTGVISGWTEGLTGQKVGSAIRLTIPSNKAYGASGSGIIPANAPLEFIVIINSVK
jgi:FKBP-type peptidyl-prolyl cis-trans isomerase